MKKNVNIMAVITARGGSKGVPRKNIKPLNGKPLIAWAIEAAKNSKYLTKFIVSTDDEEIAKIAKKYGAEVPFLRPNELAQDDTPDLPVFQHAINFFEKKKSFYPEIIIHLRPTTPLRTGKDIDVVIEKLIKTGADGVRTINLVTENPHWMDVIVNGDILKSFIPGGRKYKRRQDLPKVYRTNGLVDAIRCDVIMKKNSMYAEKNQRAVITEELRGYEIDTELDFLIINQLLNQGLVKI